MKKNKILHKEQNRAESKIHNDCWTQMDRNTGKFTDDFMSDRDQGNPETREALDEACEGKNLSRTYDNIEEMFDELDAEYDDYPEITQKDFDRAVKRKGLKPISEAKENPFDVLAKQAKQESQAGTTVTLEDFERQMKKRVSQKSSGKAVKGLKKT